MTDFERAFLTSIGLDPDDPETRQALAQAEHEYALRWDAHKVGQVNPGGFYEFFSEFLSKPDPDDVAYHTSQGRDISVHGCCGIHCVVPE